MTRRFPPAKWVLPDVVDPPRRRCFVIEVPDNLYHIMAFRGALLNLASGYQWADDLAHTAKDVALVWRGVIEAMHECAPPNFSVVEDDMAIFRQEGCLLQTQCADGSWVTIYDPSACVVQGVSQEQPPNAALSPGECQLFNVSLQANNIWRLPFPVNAGDTVTLTSALGGWNDGGSPTWYCPNGLQYVLGGCTGPIVLNSGDPLPTIGHMKLIAKIGATFYDIPSGSSFTIPAGVSDEIMLFQANDSDIADNVGSISFDLNYCAGTTSFVTEALSISVATGAVVTMAQTTNPAKLYKLTFSGTGSHYVPSGTSFCDAFYATGDSWSTHLRECSLGITDCGGSCIEVYRNGVQILPTPAFEPTHVYTLYMAGDGSAWTFQYCEVLFSDNSGAISLQIEEQP